MFMHMTAFIQPLSTDIDTGSSAVTEPSKWMAQIHRRKREALQFPSYLVNYRLFNLKREREPLQYSGYSIGKKGEYSSATLGRN